jgi:hypothetical protein
MSILFTKTAMTTAQAFYNGRIMGIEDDIIKAIEKIADSQFESRAKMAEYCGVTSADVSRWINKERRPLKTIGAMLDALNFQIVVPGEKPKVATSQSEVDRIWGAVSRIMRERGVDRDTVDEIGDVILGTEKRHKQKAVGDN